MKKQFFVLLLCFPFMQVQAQYLFKDASNVIEAEQFVKNDLHLLNSIRAKLIYYVASPVAQHYTFQITKNDIEVWAWKVKLNIANNGKILSYIKNIGDIDELNALPNITVAQNDLEVSLNQKKIKVFYKSNNTWLLADKIQSNAIGKDSTYFVDENNNLLFSFSNARYLKKDTIIQAKVFLPDPITTAQQYYAASYVDNNDSNATWLGNAQQLTNIPATFVTDSNKFILENNIVKMVDYDLPFIHPVSKAMPDFFYNRSEFGFEDVNIFYYISSYHKYLDSIGYGALMNLQINVDAHGQNGADQSNFTASGPAPILNIGTGGVDDGEDADVIIHEYSHGISWSANNNTVYINERSALDEGLADYFATSYSKSIDTFRWADMFTWDGHNEFWDGRVANTTNQYIAPFVQGEYYGAEIWNAAMMKIWDAIGRQTTDKIMLQAMYSFNDSTKFPEAAAYVLQADSLLNGAVNRNTICWAFQSKNIDPKWGCWPMQIANVNNEKNIQLFNQQAFANRVGDLQIQLPEATDAKIVITNMQGQTVLLKNISNQQNIYLSSSLVSSAGMYCITVQSTLHQFHSKIILY